MKNDLDFAIFKRAQSGDADARDAIARHYRSYVFTVAREFGRENRGDPDDHRGAALFALARAINHYNPDKCDRFSGYLRAIVTRALMDLNKKDQRRFDRTVFNPTDDEAEPLFDRATAPDTTAPEIADAIERTSDPLARRLFVSLQSTGDIRVAAKLSGVRTRVARYVLGSVFAPNMVVSYMAQGRTFERIETQCPLPFDFAGDDGRNRRRPSPPISTGKPEKPEQLSLFAGVL
jgi:DNA-directed RNA polymerase specialized sigma24 family protein